MRMLFYTAAAIAATLATIGQAVKLESVDNDMYISDNSFSQIDAFQSGQVVNLTCQGQEGSVIPGSQMSGG